MVAFAFCAAAIVAIFSFYSAEREAQRALLVEWRTQIAQRGRYESQRFLRAEALTDRFARRFLDSYTDPNVFPSPDFEAYYQHMPDGTVRLRSKYYSGYRDRNGLTHSGVSGFVARNRPELTPELKRRLVITYQTVAEFGPAASGEFMNVHASLPENALIINWPGQPWGLDADSDLDMTALSVIGATLPSQNPQRKPIWTGLYFDATASKWAITFQRPVDWKGRHLINPSVDVGLTELIGDVVDDRPDGIYDLILSHDGKLIAHPAGLDDRNKKAGQISVEQFGNPAVTSIYRQLANAEQRADGVGRVTYAPELDAYVASVGLEGPKWWLVTVYPKSVVQARALRSAGLALVLIAALFGAFILTVVLVLRASVSKPIRQMTEASHRLADGDYTAVANGSVPIPTKRNDEIGMLARSFQFMAGQVDSIMNRLEHLVTERTIELELANQQLAERSLRDGLTGAFNRRAFDQDLEKALDAVDKNGVTVSLALFDVDFFKAYNDHYGHVAGDKALERIVACIGDSLPGAKVYRYGGEEIAAIIPCRDGREAEEKVRQAVRDVEGLAIAHAESAFGRLTASAGAMLLDDASRSRSEVLERVDQALYAAKEAGRNRSIWS